MESNYVHHTLALFSFWLKDIGLSVTYRDSSYKQQDNLLLKVETTMDLESMECWDRTWDDCQVAEEGKACSLEVSRLSLVRMLEAAEEGLATRVRTTSVTLESETNQCSVESSDVENHLHGLVIHSDDIFTMESIETVSTLSPTILSTMTSTSGENGSNLKQVNAAYNQPKSLKTFAEAQYAQYQSSSEVLTVIENVASLPYAFTPSSNSLEEGDQTSRAKLGRMMQRDFKQTTVLEQGLLSNKSITLGNKQGRSLEEGEIGLRSFGVEVVKENVKARQRHSSQPVAIPQHPSDTLVIPLTFNSIECSDVGLSIAQIAKQIAAETCGSLPAHPRPPRSRDLSKTFDESISPDDNIQHHLSEIRSMELEFLSPLDSDDSIHEDTEIEIATVMDQIALLNPEGKCRA